MQTSGLAASYAVTGYNRPLQVLNKNEFLHDVPAGWAGWGAAGVASGLED